MAVAPTNGQPTGSNKAPKVLPDPNPGRDRLCSRLQRGKMRSPLGSDYPASCGSAPWSFNQTPLSCRRGALDDQS